ncbi:uncharacterized protein (TIGR00369 family) [Aureimonas pseudogalii]|uniref:Uncharacterized protein (TIGR00369 family) n=2 Tax=Aureimonas pseudogalii TaxID=1744844 RepID=A0A7W6EBI7_9HYPH|nr:uncharacterized protein (TIGR00369 family) [Aureimonas pseudogalii]
MNLAMSIDEVAEFLDREFPQAGAAGLGFRLDTLEAGRLTLSLAAEERHLRPGGTVSGPSLFALADVAAYLCILAHLGPLLHVVTTNMSINFLQKPPPGLLRAEASLLKLGRRLAVVEVSIRGAGDDLPSAHAVGTYAIPPETTE